MRIQPQVPLSDSANHGLIDLVAADGTATHRYCAPAIARSADAFVRNPADFADAAHHLAMLHGHMPGVVDHAANHVVENAARGWLLQAMSGFGRERAYLNQMVVAAGPMPSTPGQQNMTGIVAQQQRALDMLAQSDRRGCALGAAIALILDWAAVRVVLDAGAVRLGLRPLEMSLPDRDATAALLGGMDRTPAVVRAVDFGARQLLTQHRGIWDLLEARMIARRDAA